MLCFRPGGSWEGRTAGADYSMDRWMNGCPVITLEMSRKRVKLKSHLYGISMDGMGQVVEILFLSVLQGLKTSESQ